MHPHADQFNGLPVAEEELSLSPVNRWRFNVFVDAGFDHLVAHQLAVSKTDVHQVLRALKSGCSLELALEIFL